MAVNAFNHSTRQLSITPLDNFRLQLSTSAAEILVVETLLCIALEEPLAFRGFGRMACWSFEELGFWVMIPAG